MLSLPAKSIFVSIALSVIASLPAQAEPAAPVNLPPAETKPFSASQVCRAAIAGIFGREVKTVKAAKTKTEGVFNITYRRPDDGKRFSFDCKLSDDNIIWTESGYSSDRWMGKGSVETNVDFTVNGSELTITEKSASLGNSSYDFTLNELR